MRKTTDPTTPDGTGTRRGLRRRHSVLAGALAAVAFTPVLTVATPRPAQAESCSAAFSHVVNAIGVLPVVGGYVSGLANFIEGFTGSWDCAEGRNLLEELNRVARAQAEIVFNQNMQEIFDDDIQDQIDILAANSYPDQTTDANREALVDDLDAAWKKFSSSEQTGRNLSYLALPSMSALAGVKMATLTQAIQYETLRVDKWRTLQNNRIQEATQSLSYLTQLESKLNTAVNSRFVRGSHTISTACGQFSCSTRFKIYVKDNEDGSWVWSSQELLSGGIAPNPAQDAALNAAIATADSVIGQERAKMRNAYLTTKYQQIKAALTAHKNSPAHPVFHTRGSVCNDDQYVILRALDQDLTIRAGSGPVEESGLVLSGTLAEAFADHDAHFKMIRFGKSFMLKARDADLTVNVWGGSQQGNRLKLHGDQAYAEDHPNSLFHVFLMADPQRHDELILKVSDQDLTVNLSSGQQSGSTVRLFRSLTAAQSDSYSRFRFACYPVARRAA
ncbi:hypothetical protein [Paractinoplanes hotanensis]|uniref:Uncharacterized protein n=1 Tax=Paractinoplanes hotanensis TaxID=2906497 RepID=A0ABT0XX31_9ACTN|nr:hypothetical protein [Actinoplanes hotanensis]MCM4078324.1 hypothetical protein [Actinoplanes hotanensis]